MSSVKISALTQSYNVNANPAHSLLITSDIDTNTTTSISASSLASSLYSNTVLNVGKVGITLPNLVAQFTGLSGGYIQVNEQNINANGTADYIVTADVGNDTNYYLDLGITNSTYSNNSPYNSLGTSIEPLSGYLYVQGNTSTSQSGNLVIGTIQPNTETRFIAGGINSNNVVVKIKSSGLYASNLYSNNMLVLTSETIGPVAFNKANSANIIAQAAFNKANNALANTTGTFAGDLTLTGNVIAAGIQSTSGAITTGNLIINGTTYSNGTANISGTLNVSGIVTMNATVFIQNTSFTPSQSALTISASNTVATPSQDGYMIHISGKQNVASRIIADSYGASNNYVVYAGRSARGNVTNPSAVQAGDILSRFSGNGYGTTGYAPIGTGRIDFVASENYTDSARGSQIQFWNTPTGTNTLTQIASFNGTSVTFVGTVQPQKGFIYTPTVYPGAQTAITIDFANNSVVRAQTATGLTASLSNLTVGKEVVAWFTNTAGTNQTFTHGVSATNSTTNSTSYNIPGTSTILVRYMCIDGTTQNTFVSITHA
jgi:hypothetical protein